jgi:hypothetical protein
VHERMAGGGGGGLWRLGSCARPAMGSRGGCAHAWVVEGATRTAIAAATSAVRRISCVLIPTVSFKSACRPPPTSTQRTGQPGAAHSTEAARRRSRHPRRCHTGTDAPCASTALAGSAPACRLPGSPPSFKLPGPAHGAAQRPCSWHCRQATAGSHDRCCPIVGM